MTEATLHYSSPTPRLFFSQTPSDSVTTHHSRVTTFIGTNPDFSSRLRCCTLSVDLKSRISEMNHVGVYLPARKTNYITKLRNLYVWTITVTASLVSTSRSQDLKHTFLLYLRMF